jgi:hypothetical protein
MLRLTCIVCAKISTLFPGEGAGNADVKQAKRRQKPGKNSSNTLGMDSSQLETGAHFPISLACKENILSCIVTSQITLHKKKEICALFHKKNLFRSA